MLKVDDKLIVVVILASLPLHASLNELGLFGHLASKNLGVSAQLVTHAWSGGAVVHMIVACASGREHGLVTMVSASHASGVQVCALVVVVHHGAQAASCLMTT